MQFIDLKSQYQQIQENVNKRIASVLDSGRYILGPEVEELEKELAVFTSTKHCITVSNGTDALLMAFLALDVKPGDEVITSPFSFIAVAEMIALLGAKPVFVDIDPETYNLDPKLLESAMTEKTKTVVPVNLYGQCAEYDLIHNITSKYDIPVIEDAAQSFGATYKGKVSCGLATIGCASFYPAKPLGCYGDGGACFTNDDNLAELLRQLRDHGQSGRYQHSRIGINGRLDTLQAAILLEKLSIFPKEVEARIRIGKRYTHLLHDRLTLKPPRVQSHNTSVYAQYTIEVDSRDEVQAKLKEQGIPTAVHYLMPLHLQPAFAYLGIREGSFPCAEKAAQNVISLPMHPYLSETDQDRVVDALLRATS